MEQTKISDLISELVALWMSWMKFDNMCKDSTLPFGARKDCAIECERLINREYELVEMLDSYFDK